MPRVSPPRAQRSATWCNTSKGRTPGCVSGLCEESGELRRFVNVYVNGEDVRFLQGLGTALGDGDEISIVPAVAGG